MKILVVRRDNIGDLVCTTPLFTLLRRRYPEAWIGALVNSYNAPVLERNPDLSAVIAYDKLKHLEPGQSRLRALAERLGSLWRLRRARLDWVVLATTSYVPRLVRLARWLSPRQLVGYADSDAAARSLDLSLHTREAEGRHEVERVVALARLLDAHGALPPLTVVSDPAELAQARAAFGDAPGPRVAVHISARRPAQRWPAERFAALIEKLAGCNALLLWSPGAASDPRHPGDDDKAREIVERLGRPAAVHTYRTERLPQLVAALAACDALICSDGGAMHVAAALGKPMVALFGDSPVERWRPWKVQHEVLQPASRNVMDIPVEAVAQAFQRVLRSVAA